MHSLAVASPKTGSDPAPAAVAADPVPAPPASLAAVPLSRGRHAIEICDKPGEITLLLQLGHGRAPSVGALDHAVFDPGSRQRLIGDFDELRNDKSSRPSIKGFFKKIYRIFLQIPK